MAIKNVSDLSGKALNWAVAKCEGYRLDLVSDDSYNPSNYWEQGGPIIERKRINTLDNGSSFSCFYSRGKTVNQRWDGPTPLIAAMRCYVASKLGVTIDIPEEIK
jgi:hypothetical protein